MKIFQSKSAQLFPDWASVPAETRMSSSLGTDKGRTPTPSEMSPVQTPQESTPNPGPQKPRFAISEGPFPEYMQKNVHFYTHFQENYFAHDLRQTEHFPSNYKTLIDAFGRQNSVGVGG